MLDSGGPLAGRVAIITGAGRGIGRSIALALGQAGASLVLAARTLAEIHAAAADLRAIGVSALPYPVDISDGQAVESLVHFTVQELGALHILVNNAGVQGCIGPLVENEPDEWVQAVQVNLLGLFYCCRAVLPYMIRQRSGKMINLSGGGATAPRPNFSAYAASKAAVVRLTETLAEEVKEYNIQVNAIAPGAVNTRMLQETLAAGPAAGQAEQIQARRQLETGGRSAELAARLAVFLASDASNRLTGKLISASHDPWQTWNAEQMAELTASPWLTLRRIDPYTLSTVLDHPANSKADPADK